MTNEKAIMCLEDMRIKVPIPKAAKQARENNEALDVAIKALKNEPHWIQVTERLPEYGKEVLTVNKDGDYEINYIIDDEEGDFFYYGAIAWMPLPEPYKGVTE